jgi:hypothetical protein
MYLASWGMYSRSPQACHVSPGSANVQYDTATGIAFIYTRSTLPFSDDPPSLKWGDAYLSIALSLNVLLTLMIAARLFLHLRGIRNAVGALDRASGLYKAIIAMLVESGALYALSFLLLVGPWASMSVVHLITLQILPEIQVRIVFPLPRCTSIPRSCLTMMANRSLHHSSSSFRLPVGLH